MENSSTSSDLKSRRNYFGKFRFMCKIVGMSLERNNSVAYKVYSLVFIFMPTCSYALIRILQLLLMHDTATVGEKILYPYAVTTVLAKSLVFLRNRAKLAKLLDKLEREPYLPNPSRGDKGEDEKLQNNCMKIIKIQSCIYVGVTVLLLTLMATITLVSRITSDDYHDWGFPYRQITVLNLTYSPNYELWWFYENLSIHIVGTQFVIIDAIIAAVLAYISFQFKMLQNSLRRIVEMSYTEMLKETGNFRNSGETSVVDPSMIPWKCLKKPLTQAIDYHLAILSVADEAEEVLSGLMLYLFLNTLGELGVLVGPTALVTRGATLLTCGQLFISCFWGQQVMHESQEVGRIAFETNFVGADLRFQKSLALIIRRSQNPVVITAGKFTAVSLPTFLWILRAGYSASTVLQQMK